MEFVLSAEILLNGLGALSIIAIAWAWRLSLKVKELEITQNIKIDKLCKIEDTVDTMNQRLSTIEGMLKEWRGKK